MPTRLSHSALETFRHCPQKYKFMKVDKIKVPKPMYAHLVIGNVVHRQVRKAFELANKGLLYPLEAMLAAYDAEFEGPNRDKIVPGNENATVDDEMARGRLILENFYRRYQPFRQGTHLFAEKPFSFFLSDCPTKFYARIDRFWKRDDGVYEISDFKTGRPAGSRDEAFRFQMGLYQLAVQDSFPDRTIEVAQYFLKYDEVVSSRMRPDELDELAEQFRTEASAIARAEQLDDWPTKPGALCSFCEFARLCPAMRHKLVLESDDAAEKLTLQQAATLADEFLGVDTALKTLKEKHEALKEEIALAARDLNLSRIQGQSGQVTISVRPSEKLPTKSRDAAGHAALTALVRSWDESTRELVMKLDDTALLDRFRKNRLSEEQKSELSRFVRITEDVRVSAKHNKPQDSDDDSGDDSAETS
ncbi:MAG: PD-(D/E)XK nuclease family protein [candidate division Zixibacteria bacterium]|nr:PD-(D/E)XK nuclease family protein [candidate division Zixibacteria bacterium]